MNVLSWARRLVLVTLLASLPSFAQITFTPNARVFDPTSTNAQTGAEPSVELDVNDVVYATVPNGAVRLWRSTNLGANWKFLGAVDGDIVGAGGDADLEFDGLNRLYVSDLVIGLGLSSSVSRYTNHATMSSVTQRDFRTFTQPLQDRQWLATWGNQTVYLAFHDIGPENMWVATSFDGGQTFLPGIPTITDPVLLATTIPNTNDGRIHTDVRTGAVYVTFAASTPDDNAETPPFGPHRKIALSRSFDNGLTWENRIVFEGPDGTRVGNIFPAFAIDRSGNLYAVFAANLDANLQLTNPANPGSGTLNIFYARSVDRGSTWSRPVQVNSNVGSHVLPWAVAGCEGKVDIVWYGTSAVGNPNQFPASGAGAPDWHVFMAQTLNGLSETPSFAQVQVSDHVIHRGQISTGGLTGGADRRLLDFFEVDHDNAGMAHVVWADTGASATAPAQVFYARQTAGTGILGCAAPTPQFDVSGGGFLVSGDHKNSFTLSIFQENAVTQTGSVTYIDRGAAGFQFKATRITSLVKNGNRATITGDGSVNSALPTTFTINVTDNGEPGSGDTFSIALGTGYAASGNLGGGNIQVQQ